MAVRARRGRSQGGARRLWRGARDLRARSPHARPIRHARSADGRGPAVAIAGDTPAASSRIPSVGLIRVQRYADSAMRLLFIGGTGPLGASAVRSALARGHEVTVAHSGTHELPADLAVRHLHGERDELLALGGPVERTRADVLIDTRTKASNVDQLLRAARAANAGRLVVVSSTDVYDYFVAGSGYDVAVSSWHSVAGRAVLSTQTLPIAEDAPLRS